MPVNQYPIDFDQVYKGQTFTVQELSGILGIKSTNSGRFRMESVRLQALIRAHCGFTAKVMPNGELRVLTDSEAVEYNNRMIRKNMRSMRTRHCLALEVDVTNLSAEEKERYDRYLLYGGRMLQAIDRERQAIRIESSKTDERRAHLRLIARQGSEESKAG